MGRTALYRKYRPKNLGEVVGQEHITTILDAAIKGGNVSHAYLFTGQRGTGKTSIARILAHEINNIPYTQESFDIIEIDAASHGLKENVKDLIEKSVISPIKDKYKVYIIDEVHSMKHDAFNTFLKLLEEPPEHVIFILATTDPQKLPQTILSRVQRYHFRPVEISKVANHLKSIVMQEEIDISYDALKIIATRGEGSLRDSIVLLDQLSSLDQKIEKDTVENILGLAPIEKINELVNAILNKKSQEVISIINDLQNSGITGRTVLDQLTKELLIKAKSKPALFELIEKLADSTNAYDIYLKLMAVTSVFCLDSEKYIAPVEQVATVVKPIISKKQSDIKKEIVKEKPVVKEETDIKKEQPDSTEKKECPKSINWNDFIKKVKENNKTCGSSLENASYDYDGETLTLYFKSKIFRNRMNEAKWKTALKKSLNELYQAPIKIEVSEGLKPKSEQLNTVADIMGGGEVL